jgi:exopolysaccharide production protein ExoQ
MPFESIGTGPFHYTTSLLAAGLVVSAGWLARGYRPAPLPDRPRRFRGEREAPLHTPRTA